MLKLSSSLDDGVILTAETTGEEVVEGVVDEVAVEGTTADLDIAAVIFSGLKHLFCHL